MEQVLRGQVFAVSGSLSVARDAFINIINRHGGTFASSITKKVTYLVTTHSEVMKGTSKIEKARASDIPFVAESFVYASVKAGCLVDHHDFLITAVVDAVPVGSAIKSVEENRQPPLFHGLVFFLSGTLSQPRAAIAKLIEDHGGRVASSITKQVTHVVTTQVEIDSPKLDKARQMQVATVSEFFVHNSLGGGRLQDVKDYLLQSLVQHSPSPSTISPRPLKRQKKDNRIQAPPPQQATGAGPGIAFQSESPITPQRTQKDVYPLYTHQPIQMPHQTPPAQIMHNTALYPDLDHSPIAPRNRHTPVKRYDNHLSVSGPSLDMSPLRRSPRQMVGFIGASPTRPPQTIAISGVPGALGSIPTPGVTTGRDDWNLDLELLDGADGLGDVCDFFQTTPLSPYQTGQHSPPPTTHQSLPNDLLGSSPLDLSGSQLFCSEEL